MMNMKKRIITKQDVARSYDAMPNLINRLPWRDYNEKYKCFLLEDNQSLGVCFRISPIPCEARPDTMMEEIAKSISEAIKNALPCEKEDPWVLQVYVKKETDLTHSYQHIENYFLDKIKSQRFTESFLQTMKEHLTYVTQPGGIFHDSQVMNLTFRGGIMHVYAVLYRRRRIKKENQDSREKSLQEILRISRKFSSQLRASGMQVRRMNDAQFYQWMVHWFNPEKNGIFYPKADSKPLGFDLTEQLFYHAPESFSEGWFFNGLPHKVLTIQNMTMNPAIGHISGERKRNLDDKIFNLIDHLPEGSVFVLTVTLQAPSEVGLHLKTIQGSAVGRHAQAEKVKNEVNMAEKCLAEGDSLFPVTMAVYLKGQTLEDLHTNEAYTEVLLNSNGFKVIADNELFPIDAYLRYLPMNYDFYFDKRHHYRSRYILLSDIAKLLPFYGRNRGTGHPGMVFFNRGGEPWMYDLMVDKTKNAHFLLLGETGTGKSNLLNYLIAHDLALYQSRFFIIDAGGSFNLLGDYCESLGLSVNKIRIDLSSPVSLNPFSNGLRIIDQLERVDLANRENFLTAACDKLTQEQQDNRKVSTFQDEEEPRDILGDMVLAALIMITGGEKKEEDMIRRSDRMLIMDAIIDAAYFVKQNQREQMIASDIIEAFERIAIKLNSQGDQDKARRAREMADSMRYFTKDPVSSSFFNCPGNPWEMADVTIIDIGLFAREGYEAHRAITFASCMNNILSLAEANQSADRAIKVVCDENHIFTSIPLLADIETRIAKMGRKLGLWLWLATQNMKDFAAGASRMLAQIENWLCLSLPPDEIGQIEERRTITPEQRLLLLSAKKEKGKYTEGVWMSSKVVSLIRHVPPRLFLAMAATDQDEKYLRARIMKENSCSEIEAVKMIAEKMMQKKQDEQLDD
jgi:conjugative transfer ATPase